jgi:type III secretion system needle length determinant
MREKPETNNTGDETMESRRGPGMKDEKSESFMPSPFSGDALLRGLGGSFIPLETQAAAPVPAPDVPALAAELVERILVNTDNQAAGGEVRITLKDSVLPDTEIILRQDGERLVVQLASSNFASLEALRLAQDDLRDKLLALGRDVSIEVLDSRNSKDGEDSGHPGARSRGLDFFTENER